MNEKNYKPELEFNDKGELIAIKMVCKAKDFRKSENMVREYLEVE